MFFQEGCAGLQSRGCSCAQHAPVGWFGNQRVFQVQQLVHSQAWAHTACRTAPSGQLGCQQCGVRQAAPVRHMQLAAQQPQRSQCGDTQHQQVWQHTAPIESITHQHRTQEKLQTDRRLPISPEYAFLQHTWEPPGHPATPTSSQGRAVPSNTNWTTLYTTAATTVELKMPRLTHEP